MAGLFSSLLMLNDNFKGGYERGAKSAKNKLVDEAFAQHTRREDYKNQLARTAAGEERQRKAALLKERNQWMAEQDIDPNDRSAVIQTMGRSPYASYQDIYAKIMQDPGNLNNRTALATQKAGIDERAATQKAGIDERAATHTFNNNMRMTQWQANFNKNLAKEERARTATENAEAQEWLDEQGIDWNDPEAVLSILSRSPFSTHQSTAQKMVEDKADNLGKLELEGFKFDNTLKLEGYKKDQIKAEANEAKQYLLDNKLDPTDPNNINELLMSPNPIIVKLGKDLREEQQEQEAATTVYDRKLEFEGLQFENEERAATTAYNREQDEKNRKNELANKKLDDLAQYTLEQNVDYNDIDQATKQALSSTNPTIKQRALTKADKMVAAKEKERAHYSSEQAKSELTKMGEMLNSVEKNVQELPPLVGFWTTDSTSNVTQLIPGSDAYNYQEKVNHINRQARNLGMMLARLNHKNTGMGQLSDKEGEQLQSLISALKDVGASEEAALQGIEKTLELIDKAKQYKDYLLSLGERKKYDPSNPKGTFKFQNRFDIKRDPEQAPTAGGGRIIRDENGNPTHREYPDGKIRKLRQEEMEVQP